MVFREIGFKDVLQAETLPEYAGFRFSVHRSANRRRPPSMVGQGRDCPPREDLDK
jgi:hypothetical protein